MTPQFRKEFARFLRFAVVGTIGAVIDFGALNLIISTTDLQAIYAQAISFSAAVTSNFLWNRYWTYSDSRSKQIHRQAGQFAVVSLIGLGIRSGIFAVAAPLTEALARQLLALVELPIEAAILGTNLAVAVAVIVVLFWNFGLNRLWTYSDVR